MRWRRQSESNQRKMWKNLQSGAELVYNMRKEWKKRGFAIVPACSFT